jgi:hypothetical protein
MPSVQSALLVHGASGTQAPLAAQRGPATPGVDAHCASEEHAVHAAATQMGVAGTLPQPRLPTQSTHVAVAGSH